MVSRVPSNVLGDAAIGHLRRYGVSVDGVTRGDGRMGLYFLSAGAGLRSSSIVYDREGSSFALPGPDDFDWDRLLDGAVSGLPRQLSSAPGVQAGMVTVHKRAVGTVHGLLTAAREFGADMLAMGAYSHSRLRQLILGGVTRHVLENATLPVLMNR